MVKFADWKNGAFKVGFSYPPGTLIFLWERDIPTAGYYSDNCIWEVESFDYQQKSPSSFFFRMIKMQVDIFFTPWMPICFFTIKFEILKLKDTVDASEIRITSWGW